MGVKSLLKKLLLPPLQLEWETGYASWPEALEATAGYDDEAVLEATLAAARAAADGSAALDRDGVLLDEIQYSWPLLAALLYVGQRRGSLRVVDVGGALGSSFRQNKALLEAIPGFHWAVVEQAHVAEIGTREFATDQLSFHSEFSEAAIGGVDVVLFGASLCYLEDPFGYLGLVANADVPFLALDRTPFVDGVGHELTVQRVRMPNYQASYPCWRFSKSAFESWLAGTWSTALRWEAHLQPDPGSLHRGYLLERVT